jgi:oligopeptide/dipeptide ABC transporter ATP-binding protein
MYLGRIVEIAETEEVFKNPHHPYTKALLESIPQIGEKDLVKKDLLEGDIPSPINPPSGCTFHTRCPYAQEICSKECPQMRDINEKHRVACHLF